VNPNDFYVKFSVDGKTSHKTKSFKKSSINSSNGLTTSEMFRILASKNSIMHIEAKNKQALQASVLYGKISVNVRDLVESEVQGDLWISFPQKRMSVLGPKTQSIVITNTTPIPDDNTMSVKLTVTAGTAEPIRKKSLFKK
jgi:hypothetical protein